MPGVSHTLTNQVAPEITQLVQTVMKSPVKDAKLSIKPFYCTTPEGMSEKLAHLRPKDLSFNGRKNYTPLIESDELARSQQTGIFSDYVEESQYLQDRLEYANQTGSLR